MCSNLERSAIFFLSTYRNFAYIKEEEYFPWGNQSIKFADSEFKERARSQVVRFWEFGQYGKNQGQGY